MTCDKKLDQLIVVAELLIVLADLLKTIWFVNDLLSALQSYIELLGSNASPVNRNISLVNVSSFCGLPSLSKILESGISHSKSLVVMALFEEDFSHLVDLLGKAVLGSVLDVCLVRAIKELLKVVFVAIATHSITDDKLRVDFPVFDSLFSGLLQILD